MANILDPDEVAHNEPPHLDLHCLQIYLVCFLAHLSHRLRVSYCHWPMSVVRRASSTIVLKNISSETARPRALIFGM